MIYPQASFYPQANFYPQGGFGGQGSFGGNPYSPLNALYGISQQTPAFAQGLSPYPNWQHFAPQAALQQQAIQQLLAQQQSMHQPGISGLNGASNGAAQASAWRQQQLNPEQINPALLQQPYHHLLQQLAQYHHFVAQQLTQLAAQSVQGTAGAYPFAGQFIPNQLGANFVPGITMH
jgi:hypothetical protein